MAFKNTGRVTAYVLFALLVVGTLAPRVAFAQGEGLIVRAAAVAVQPPVLQRELSALRAHWGDAAAALRDAQPPVLALDEGDGLARLLRGR